MKLKPALFCAALALMATPALAQGGGDAGVPMPDIENMTRKVPPEPEARAEDLAQRGRCDLAIPIYRALASQGAGFELSELNLGTCLITVAKTEPNPATADGYRREGAQWIIKAANADLPNAQRNLVSLYLDGTGVPADPVEAGKWSLLYHANGARRNFGLPDNAPDIQARLNTALNDQAWAQAHARANAWVPITLGQYNK